MRLCSASLRGFYTEVAKMMRLVMPLALLLFLVAAPSAIFAAEGNLRSEERSDDGPTSLGLSKDVTQVLCEDREYDELTKDTSLANDRTENALITGVNHDGEVPVAESLGQEVTSHGADRDDEVDHTEALLGRRSAGRRILQSSAADKSVLLAFKKAISKDPNGTLAGWNTSANADYCQWYGVVCNKRTKQVIGLNITGGVGSKLQGSLTPKLALLTSLTNITLQNHSFTGPVPGDLGQLTSLQVLQLHDNDFTGKIPTELAMCTNLRILDLGANNLTGPLPVQLVNCSHLESIDVSSNILTCIIDPAFGTLRNLTSFLAMWNGFTGRIPSSFGNCSKLVSFSVNNNHLTGTVPFSFGNCSQLQGFLIGYNNISGSLPVEFGKLQKLSVFFFQYNNLVGGLEFLQNCSAMWLIHGEYNNLSGPLPKFGDYNCSSLEQFYVKGNNFSGSIPASYGKCTGLTNIGFSNNNLTGSIPASLGNLVNMQSFQVDNNQLTGSIPPSLGNFSNVQYMYFDGNDLNGTIPSSLANCMAMIQLHLYNNPRLTGTIPPELGRLQNLQNLVIYGTQVYGNIPESLGNCSSLVNLVLYNNSLNGRLPTGLGRLSNLSRLLVSDNELTGPIPSTLGQCTALSTFDLTNNMISGVVPGTLGNCTKLVQLSLGSNRLEGNFTVDFSKMTELQTLSIFNNSITGDIFKSLFTYTNFTVVDVSWNSFTGEIPATYNETSFSALRVLLLGHNQLEGPIPSWLWDLPVLQVLDLSNNHLSGLFAGNFSNLRGYIDQNATKAYDNSSTLYNQNIAITVKDQTLIYTSILSILTSMDLSENHVGGDMPANIDELKEMVYFNLSRNAFTGTIPPAIGEIALESLDLSNNLLDGGIPDSLGSQTRLIVLNLANNNLSGPIPSGTQFSTFTASSFLPGNKGLCGTILNNTCETPSSPIPTELSPGDSFSDIFSIPGLILGAIIGFVSVSSVFLFWDPARDYINISNLDKHKHVGAWQPRR